MNTIIPEGYQSLLSMYDTQKAISLIHRLFEDRLGALLNLYRVSAPLFVEENSGLNDNLNGVERPVSFEILRSNHKAQVVQSLAKWKRLALKRYGFFPGKGLYTDMNGTRSAATRTNSTIFIPSMSTSGTGKRLSCLKTAIWTI